MLADVPYLVEVDILCAGTSNTVPIVAHLLGEWCGFLIAQAGKNTLTRLVFMPTSIITCYQCNIV